MSDIGISGTVKRLVQTKSENKIDELIKKAKEKDQTNVQTIRDVVIASQIITEQDARKVIENNFRFTKEHINDLEGRDIKLSETMKLLLEMSLELIQAHDVIKEAGKDLYLEMDKKKQAREKAKSEGPERDDGTPPAGAQGTGGNIEMFTDLAMNSDCSEYPWIN